MIVFKTGKPVYNIQDTINIIDKNLKIYPSNQIKFVYNVKQ